MFIGSQRSIRDRLALVVWPQSGEPTIIVCSVEEPQTRAESFIKDVRSYVEFKTSPIDVLVDVLKEKGLDNSNLGIELHYLTAHYFQQVTSSLPKVSVAACDTLLAEARMIKTDEEIARLTQGARATERALLATYITIRTGETEKSMTNRLADAMMLVGAETTNFLYISAGPNTGYPHCLGTDYECMTGDVVKTDCGGTFSGYVSDVARTGVIGKPSDEQSTIYLLKFVDHKCFGMNVHSVAMLDLLIFVERLCFDRYKIDYIPQDRARIAGRRFGA